jgi:hypothetical protein
MLRLMSLFSLQYVCVSAPRASATARHIPQLGTVQNFTLLFSWNTFDGLATSEHIVAKCLCYMQFVCECPKGFSPLPATDPSNPSGAGACVRCLPGSYRTDTDAACMPCPPGTYSNALQKVRGLLTLIAIAIFSSSSWSDVCCSGDGGFHVYIT